MGGLLLTLMVLLAMAAVRTGAQNSSVEARAFLPKLDFFVSTSVVCSFFRSRQLAMGDLLGTFIGASSSLNVWNPNVEMTNEYSASQITLVSSNLTNLIEIGWHVYPLLYEDNETHLFVRWTILDESGRIGCFNTNCQGFIQTSTNIIVGLTLDNMVSDLNGTQYTTALAVLKDGQGDWWVYNDNEKVGYFPFGLLPEMDSGGAAIVSFGGRVLNKWNENRHTYTEMGSGFFPLAGYGFSAFQVDLVVTDADNVTTKLVGEHLIQLTFDNVGDCYYTYVEQRTGRLYFGGTGYNPRCQTTT
ncbi:uncharacterized protein LOC112349705 isoform X2 [Selaginella moellendorffii]|uniref:uncharacterized protein LOC112349705 isoform X2 n=1 Tax=Selaginella moellendorffii TaxID=88036 RepID=UPI000D1C9F3F|nr:uncharacterized protein LOC112349705 isoform X2 [Selaginella moellendorffii]|eukprot:XP_024540388.1 uncharacterized protein LOC112349705 isoform X2 [Selaginella moellendorffii]